MSWDKQCDFLSPKDIYIVKETNDGQVELTAFKYADEAISFAHEQWWEMLRAQNISMGEYQDMLKNDSMSESPSWDRETIPMSAWASDDWLEISVDEHSLN